MITWLYVGYWRICHSTHCTLSIRDWYFQHSKEVVRTSVVVPSRFCLYTSVGSTSCTANSWLSTSSEETLHCLPSLPVKQHLMFRILLFSAQLPAVQWNIGGVTMLPLMNHSNLIEDGGDALSLSWTRCHLAESQECKNRNKQRSREMRSRGWAATITYNIWVGQRSRAEQITKLNNGLEGKRKVQYFDRKGKFFFICIVKQCEQ